MGPKTDPCGTPEVTWILSDVAPSSMTRCVRDVKNVNRYWLYRGYSFFYRVYRSCSATLHCLRPAFLSPTYDEIVHLVITIRYVQCLRFPLFTPPPPV